MVEIIHRSNSTIAEEFVGCRHAVDLTGQGLALLLMNYLKRLGLDISKCRGQGYDGAGGMMGKMRELF